MVQNNKEKFKMRINKKTQEDIVEEEVKVETSAEEQSIAPVENQDKTVEDAVTVEKVKEEVDDTPIAILGTGVTQKQLAAWKEKFGKKNIFKTAFLDDIFVWHKLNRAAFSSVITATKDIKDKEEQVTKCEQEFVRAAVLWPEITEEFLKDEDVTVSGLSEEILFRSGFVPAQTERV